MATLNGGVECERERVEREDVMSEEHLRECV